MANSREAGDQENAARCESHIDRCLGKYMRGKYHDHSQHPKLDTKNILSELTEHYGEAIFTEKEVEHYKKV